MPLISLKRALFANRLVFLLFGMVFAVWATQLPLLKNFYHYDNGNIAVTFFIMAVGALFGLTQAGRIVHILGMMRAQRLLWTISLSIFPLIYVFPISAALWIEVFVIGFCSGAIDVLVNVEATDLERHAKRPLLSGIHGMFSLGGMLGAALTSQLLDWGVSSVEIFSGLAVIGISCNFYASRFVLPIDPAIRAAETDKKFIWPHGLIAWLALATTIGMVIEGAIYDWSTLLMVETFNSPPTFAAWSYAAFSGAMALGRFGGDALRARISAPRLIAYSAILLIIALSAGLLIRNQYFMLLVFGLSGIAIANWVPVFYASATQYKSQMTSAQAISSLATVGYLGFLIGPILLGYAARSIGLLLTFWGLVLLSAVMAIFAPSTLRRAAKSA